VNLLGTSFFRRLVWLTLFLAPIGYTANIFAVAVHEIVGHGLVAQLLGGRFIGFWMKSDGMGGAFAFAAADAPVSHSIIILAGGVIATTLVGFILLVVAIVLRRWLLSRLVLLVLSAACLLEGPPYVFWNAYHPVPPGDIGRVFELCTLNGLADVTGYDGG